MALKLEEQYEKIYRYCYYRVNNTTLAEDLTQETFLKYLSSGGAQKEGKTLAYLYTIARNSCIDMARKRVIMPISEEIAAEDELVELESRLVIKNAVFSLTDELREVIMLRFANDLAIGDIAAILGVSRFVVRRRQKAAMEILKKTLKEEDFE